MIELSEECLVQENRHSIAFPDRILDAHGVLVVKK